jgi:hypothetical protein
MQTLLESIDRYIEQKIEAVLGDRRFFNHADVVGFIDQRIENALQSNPLVEDCLAKTVALHLGGDGEVVVKNVAETIAESREFKTLAVNVIQRHCHNELKEAVEESLLQALTDYFEEEPGALQQAVDNFMNEDDGVEIVRKAIKGFTFTINE